MMKKLFFLLVLVVVLFGCSQKQPVNDAKACSEDAKECPDGSFVSRNPDLDCEFNPCPSSSVPSSSAAAEKPVEKESTNIPIVAELQTKAKSIANYEYVDGIGNHIYLVKGDKVVVMTNLGNEFRKDGISYNSVFLDTTKKTAFAACVEETNTRDTFNCMKNRDKYTVWDYSSVSIPQPFEHLMKMQDAKLVGSGTVSCESVQCYNIEYTLDGQKYRMQVRQRNALPFRISTVDSEGKEKKVAEYTNAAFDHLKESDVTVPSTFTLVG
jgi:outer membrane lipoprotein-sorting protein